MNLIQMPLGDNRLDQELSVFHYARILDAIKEAVCLINSMGEIQYVNAEYCHLFQVQKSKLVGKSIYRVISDDLTLECLKSHRACYGKIEHKGNLAGLSVSAEPIIVSGQMYGVLSRYILEDASDIMVGKAEPIQLNDYMLINPFVDFYITENQKLISELIMARKAALSSSTILILGESGTGKELISKGIHRHSRRKDKPFIAVNCAAIPINLIESELFGHEQGAFTGAIKTKIGKFELANGGTIFLDEIGDLPLELQVKLLRVIQEMEIQRVGGHETLKIDVRIIAATHRNLEEMIKEDKFREDLYYRLNVIPIQLMPLRERIGDIRPLVKKLCNKISLKMELEVVEFEDETIDVLESWQWPGNIRELENIVERAIVLCEGQKVSVYDLPKEMNHCYEIYKERQLEIIDGIEEKDPFQILIEQGSIQKFEYYESVIIQMAIDKHKSYNAAGKALGLTHKTVAAKVKKYGLYYGL
ncbi:MAG: sigma 54-interacting transcriptional regulator [Acidaminobacteraceae bacterium]